QTLPVVPFLAVLGESGGTEGLAEPVHLLVEIGRAAPQDLLGALILLYDEDRNAAEGKDEILAIPLLGDPVEQTGELTRLGHFSLSMKPARSRTVRMPRRSTGSTSLPVFSSSSSTSASKARLSRGLTSLRAASSPMRSL